MRCRLAVLVLAVLLAGPARAADLHVDPLGDDTAPGSADAPWRTVQYAVRQAQPGDTVILHPGTYAESVDVDRSGAEGAPIVVRALAGAELTAPSEDGSPEGIDVAAGIGHLVFDGLHVTGFAESILLRTGAHDVVIRDCAARRGDVGIWLAGVTRVVVEGCLLQANRLGLRVSGAASDITVRDTASIGNDDGLACEGDADGFSVEETAREVRFVGCAAVANGEDGFDLQGDRVFVEQGESRDNACAGIKLGQHARVENTLVAGNGTGIAAGSFFGAPVRAEIVNSTVVDNRGVQLLLRARAADPARPSTVLLRNLIVAGAGKLVEIESPLTLREDHNLLFRPDTASAAIVHHRQDGEHRYSGQAINAGLWALESGQGSGTLAVDPRFADLERYAVAADSAAVDRGALEVPTVDRGGAPRPAGLAADIGADELPTASGNHPPWAEPGPDRDLAVGARHRVLAAGSVDPDGDPLAYGWDFGDGSPPAQGYAATHAWDAPGAYVLTLTVSDGELTHARTARILVVDATPPPTPTATPTVAGHDSSLRVARDRVRLRIRRGQAQATARLPVTIGNDDVAPLPERPGHIIQLLVEPGTCPDALQIVQPDFAPRRRGGQQAMVVPGGRRRRAEVRLHIAAAAIETPDRRRPLRCTLILRAIGPGDDPTPGDNVAAVEVEIRDDNDAAVSRATPPM
jgi:hypothetical protein